MRGEFAQLNEEYVRHYPDIPLILLSKTGKVSHYDKFQRASHLVDEGDEWAMGALNELQNQTREIQKLCPELLHCFHRQGGSLVITQGPVELYREHVLGWPVSPTVPGSVALGLAHNFRDEDGKVRIANIFWDEGFFLPEAGRNRIVKAAWAVVAHELTHTADRKDTVMSGVEVVDDIRYGRHTETPLFRAIVNLESGTNPKSASAEIRSEVRRYDEGSKIHEYLPRMMERYVTQRPGNENPLSELERSYIENVFLPDVVLRAGAEHQKMAILENGFKRPLRNQLSDPALADVVLTPLPPHVIKGTSMDIYPHRDVLRQDLMRITQSIVNSANRSLNISVSGGTKPAEPGEEI